MNCPSCSETLKEVKVGEKKVRVCGEGCGGAWFDYVKLEIFDALADAALSAVPAPPKPAPPAPPKGRVCPKCKLVVMRRHFFSMRREAEVESCGGCGGMWIERAALAKIRAQFKSGEERVRETRKFYDGIFDAFVRKKR